MFKQLLFFFVFISLVGFASAVCEDGCQGASGCLEYGAVESGQYCDYLTGLLVSQKTNGSNSACVNDFECATNYSCIDGNCDNSYNTFIELLNSGNLTGFCLGTGLFCYNGTQPSNTTLLNNSCGFAASCYKCNSPYTWNETLSRCIPAACSATPGCLNLTSLNLTSLNNSATLDKFCAVGSCFECSSDYNWNNSTNSCALKACTSSPGCLNVSNFTNAKVLNKYCSSGSCFICNSGYVWNSTKNECVSSSTTTITYSTTVQLSASELSAGSSKTLKIADRLQFSFENIPYELVVSSVSPSTSKMNYRINPVYNNLVAVIGANNKFDLNSDGIFDINVKLESISNGQAIVSITKEAVSTTPSNPVVTTPITPSSGDDKPAASTTKDLKGSGKNTAGYLVIVFLVILVVLIVIVIFAIISKKKAAASANSDGSQMNGYRSNY